jgi:hypothetical protein
MTITLELPENLEAELTETAAAHGLTREELVRRAIESLLANHPQSERSAAPDAEPEADEARSARLHELIDRKFLQTITEAENQELAALLEWRDGRKNAFYREISPEQEQEA